MYSKQPFEITKEDGTKETKEFLSYIDILVDGRFIEKEKDVTLRFRGSRNQRIINLKETLKQNQTILWDLSQK